MSRRIRFPLLAKMLGWLVLHLVILAAAFYLFVAWQLRLGLDSLLSGSAGERLRALGEEIAGDLSAELRPEWPEILAGYEETHGVELFLELAPGDWSGGEKPALPRNVDQRLVDIRRPQRPPPRGPGGGPPEGRDFPRRGRPEAIGAGDPAPPKVRPAFLIRGDGGNGYWAGVELPISHPRRQAQPALGMLLLRSSDLSGGGLFFDLKPWVLGGLAVLALSLIFWAPFFLGITRFISRLSRATDAIADGKFDTHVGASRSDELGHLGASIEHMASRLDRLVRGQKRFLGDVAHELCSPLARIRTGLGVLEYGLPPDQQARLSSIEEDVAELSQLVSEILAFTKASTAPGSVKPEPLALEPILSQAAARECPGQEIDLGIPPDLEVIADRNLLSRVIANLLRNARQHAGDTATIRISAGKNGSLVALRISDDGPGVAPADLPRLFEPFYRPDSARTREAGGAGLGLAIVRAGIEACGGSVRAESNHPRGLSIVVTLPADGVNIASPEAVL